MGDGARRFAAALLIADTRRPRVAAIARLICMAEGMAETLSIYDIVKEMRLSRNLLVQTLVRRSVREGCWGNVPAPLPRRPDLSLPPTRRFNTATCTCR